MDFKQLQYFVRVAELGSFSRASTALAVAQPALSRQVRLLEVELRTSLFIRHGRGVRTTEHGKKLLEHARGILHQCDRTTELMHDDEGELSGKVAVGLPPSLCKLLAVPLLTALRERHPNICVTVREGLSTHLLEWLIGGLLDCAIVYNAPKTADVDVRAIGVEARWLVSARSNRVSTRRVSLEALSRLPLIIPSRPHATRMMVERALAELGLRPSIVAEIDGVPAILELVRGEFGHAVLPLAAVRASGHADEFVTTRIVGQGLKSSVSLVVPAKRPETPSQRAVGDELSNLAKKEIS